VIHPGAGDVRFWTVVYDISGVQVSGERLLAAGEGFTPPSSKDFQFAPFYGDSILFTKPVLFVAISVVAIATFYILAARKAALVPSRLQFAGESVYGFVRNSLGRDIIGHEFMRFTPFLVTLFSFILLNNFFGIIPFIQFPTFSRIGFVVPLALFVYVVFHWIGIRKHGFFGYFKGIMFMPGLPKPVYVLLTPIELGTFLIVRPLTLAMRLFANMFAGHLLLLVFILGGEHLLQGAIGLKLVSPFAFGVGIVMTFFEFLIQALQAYIFTLLTALYIAGALADEH
jgi:F-type H+-transporting ATPase subunit a